MLCLPCDSCAPCWPTPCPAGPSPAPGPTLPAHLPQDRGQVDTCQAVWRALPAAPAGHLCRQPGPSRAADGGEAGAAGGGGGGMRGQERGLPRVGRRGRGEARWLPAAWEDGGAGVQTCCHAPICRLTASSRCAHPYRCPRVTHIPSKPTCLLQCQNNPGFMREQCKLSCGVCCPEGDVLCERRRKRRVNIDPHTG